MKRSLYALQAFGTALLLLAATACSQDDSFAPTDSGRLPQGNEPMTFLASGLQRTASSATPASRASIDNDWKDISKIAVLMNGEAKVYDVTPAEDFLTARLTAADPFRWTTDMTTAEISAWWPYTDSDNDGIPDATIPPVVVKKDQSSDEDYANSDYIAVSNQQVSFGTPAELQFSHRTARIVLKLASSTVDLSSVSISINNLSAVNGNPQVITPRKVEDGTYEALVAPQRIMAQTQIASITTLGGKTFIYKISNETEWAEGKYYTYTIELVE